MNTVLVQECLRYNKLVAVVRHTLGEIQVLHAVGSLDTRTRSPRLALASSSA